MTKDKQQQESKPEIVDSDKQELVTNEDKIESGDTYIDKHGRILRSENNSLDRKPHSLARRPSGLGFTGETAREANAVRWGRRRASAEDGMIEAAADHLGKPVTGDEAWKAVVKVQASRALEDGQTAAAKFTGTATDSLQRAEASKPEIHAETLQIVNFNFRSLEDLQTYIEQQREIGHLKNAAFVESQVKELIDEGPVQVDVLWGTMKDD